jgi:hypothetical protein
MKNVTIRRCATCHNIGTHTDQLAADLRTDPDTKVNVVDGSKGEFSVEVDGRKVNGMDGDSLRDPSELANDIRGRKTAGAM